MNVEIGCNRTDDKYFLVEIIVNANSQHPDLYDVTVIIHSQVIGQMSKLLEASPMTAQKAYEIVTRLHESFCGDIGIEITIDDDLLDLFKKKAAAMHHHNNRRRKKKPPSQRSLS